MAAFLGGHLSSQIGRDNQTFFFFFFFFFTFLRYTGNPSPLEKWIELINNLV